MSSRRLLTYVVVILFACQARIGMALEESWVESKRVEDTVFMLMDAPARVESFDLATASWAESIPLPRAEVTTFHVDDRFLYVAYGRALYRYSRSGDQEFHMGNHAEDVRYVTSDGAVVIVVADHIVSQDRDTGATISTISEEWDLRDFEVGFSHAPSLNQVFAYNISSSPGDIVALSYEDSGELGRIVDSPHHGDLAEAENTWIFPNGSRVIDSAGNIYNSLGMRSLAALPTGIDDVAFAGGRAPVVLRNDQLVAFSQVYEEVGRRPVETGVCDIQGFEEELFLFQPTRESSRGVASWTLSFAELGLEGAGEPIDPDGVPFEPDAAFVTTDGALFLLSKKLSSLFRWDTSEQDWSASILLEGSPNRVVYSESWNGIYALYPDGRVTEISLAEASGAGPETPFARVPGVPLDLTVAGEFLVATTDHDERFRIVYDAEGSEVSRWTRPYVMEHPVWHDGNRRLYYLADGRPFWESVTADGQFGEAAPQDLLTAKRVDAPARLDAAGLFLAYGSGEIYDAASLEEVANTGTPFKDAAWGGGGLRTLSDRVARAWEGPSFQLSGDFSVDGETRRLLAVERGLAVVYIDSEQSVQIVLLDDSLNPIFPERTDAPTLRLRRHSGSRVWLAWSNVSGESGYRLERRDGAAGTWTPLVELPADTAAFADASAQRGQGYTYRAIAVYGEQVSEPSNEVEVSLEYPVMRPLAERPPMVSFELAQTVMGNGGVVYLLGAEAGAALFRWDLETRRWLARIPLDESPFSMAYSSVNHTMYLQYEDGRITAIDLGAETLVERSFARVPNGSKCELVTAGGFVLGCDEREYMSFDAAGILSHSGRLGASFGPWEWSETLDRIYFLSRGLSPVDIHQVDVHFDGSLGFTSDSPFHSSEGMNAPVRVDPSGSRVVLGSGRVFDPSTLDRVGALPATHADIGWIDGKAFTVGDSKMTRYDATNFEEEVSVDLGYPLSRIFVASDQRLVVVGAGESGGARIEVYDAVLQRAPAAALQTPVVWLDSVGLAELTLIWTDVSGESGYQVERLGPGGVWTPIGGVGEDTNRFVDGDVRVGESFAYRVRAENESTMSDYSESVQAEVSAPAPPTNLVGEQLEDGTILVRWRDGDREDEYRVERRNVDGGDWRILDDLDADTTEFRDRKVTPGVVYTYRVFAINAIGHSEPSGTVDVLAPIDAPAAPGDIGVDVLGPLAVRIYWADVRLEDRYMIERLIGDGSEDTWEFVAEVPRDSVEFFDGSVEPGSTVRYRLSAVNLGGVSEFALSEAVGIPALTAPAAPSIEGSLLDAEIGVALQWARAGDVRQYRLFRRLVGETAWDEVVRLEGLETEVVDRAVEVGNVYEYSLVAENALGASPRTVGFTIPVVVEIVLFDAPMETGPEETEWTPETTGEFTAGGPEGSSAFLYFGGSGSRLAVTPPLEIRNGGVVSFDFRAGARENDGPTWDNSEVGEEIVVEYLGAEGWEILDELDSVFPRYQDWTRVELTIPESLNGRFVIFRWRQRAHDDGEDQWGLDNVRILTRRSAPPAAPGLALVGGALPTEVTIFWLPVDSAYYYLVERREGTNGPWVEISKIDEPKTYYTDSIAEDRVYAYRVIAGNQSGLSAPTPTIVAGALTSIQAWKMREFGNVADEGIARNGFVHPSGWTTLELYAFGLSHRSAPHALDLERPARGGIPRFEIERASGRFSLTLLKRRDGSEPAIVYAVETADSIHGPWSPSGAMVVLEVIDEDWELVQWTDGVGLDDVESRYVRWRILEK